MVMVGSAMGLVSTVVRIVPVRRVGIKPASSPMSTGGNLGGNLGVRSGILRTVLFMLMSGIGVELLSVGLNVALFALTSIVGLRPIVLRWISTGRLPLWRAIAIK